MNFLLLANTGLFSGIESDEIKKALECLGFEQRRFAKGEKVFRAGKIVQSFALVLSGSVIIENTDFWGNTSVLDKIGAGHTCAETYAFAEGEALMVDVTATEQSEVLFLNAKRVMTVCSRACSYHNKLIRNLLFIFAQKNLHLSRRIFHTSSKSIRGRLMSYLSHRAAQCGSGTFCVPFNRQELADYLSVDRSALSNELSKMQKEGLLTTEKNRFCLNAEKMRDF
ncbi:Crp/Fnr family transcriptional regulator [Treponema sp. OMZ 840]|uniref:Crp/Fnr family transcriptional regulator n=1 Tax=Treponema sp. OMZ 840 TaxID=244313 RepID=UPI003D90C4BE